MAEARNGRGSGSSVRTAGWAFSLAAAVLAAGPVLAQGGGSGATADRQCVQRPGMLGLARVVEIDTTRGPRFGGINYADNDFLREGEVVLTFDDGPMRRHSRMVLEALAAHCTRATFFMVGQMAVTDPEMVQEIAQAGHTIALHTWSHRNLRASGAAKAMQEIELGISAVQRALGRPVAPFFRFPYLADSQAMLEHLSKRNFAVFSIDVDSKDFRTRDPRQMQRQIMDALTQKRKGILLFHDIQVSTATGIRGVLDDLARRGYKAVHVVPKGTMPTQPSFDAMAEAELARRNRLAAANPMVKRAVVWPMAQPGAPVDAYRPEAGGSAAARATIRTAPPGQPAAATSPAVAMPQRPAGGGMVLPAPAAAPAAQPVPAPAQAPEPPPRPELRGTRDDDDWRGRVFQY